MTWFRARLRCAMTAEAVARRRVIVSFAARTRRRRLPGRWLLDARASEITTRIRSTSRPRLAAVVTVDCLGDDPSELMGESVASMPVEPISFEYVFGPEEVVLPPSF